MIRLSIRALVSRQGETSRRFLECGLALLCAMLLIGVPVAWGHISSRELQEKVRVEPRFGKQIPGDLEFRDAGGNPVRLKDLMGGRPTILAMVYFNCPVLCSLVMKGLVESLNEVSLEMGRDFQVLAVSIDPKEGPGHATRKKNEYRGHYAGGGFDAGWHFLTGKQDAIHRLAEAVGIRYAYDAEKGQFAHPAALAVLSPQGKISRYLYGVEFSPRDVRLALVEAADERIGTLGDQIVLFCYHYDPVKGKYSFAVMNILRVAGVLTVAGLGVFMLLMFRRERRSPGGGRGAAGG